MLDTKSIQDPYRVTLLCVDLLLLPGSIYASVLYFFLLLYTLAMQSLYDHTESVWSGTTDWWELLSLFYLANLDGSNCFLSSIFAI